MAAMSEINGSGRDPRETDGGATEARASAPARERLTKRQTILVAASTVVAAALGAGGVFAVQNVTGAGSASAAQQHVTGQPAVGFDGSTTGGSTTGGYGYSGSGGWSGSGDAQAGGDPFGGGAYTGGSAGTGTGTGSGISSAAAATAAESQGIVLIDTQLGYQNAEAAGTGIVLSTNGEVLTNNHVIEGSTSITVEVPSTGKSYTATVVGDDPTDDVAVLKLQGATGLATANVDASHRVAAGDAVTGVGNAEGGGVLLAAAGHVTGLDQSITTQADGSAASESLHGLIETDAAIEPGDSGGPLYDSSDEVVGIDTAASSGGSPDGYAIPVATALDIAKRIEAGNAGGNVEIGYPAFLGVELGTADASGFAASQGAEIAGVVVNGPAEQAGLAAGDVVTAIDGVAVASADELSAALRSHLPGDQVSITWVGADGRSRSASVTLTQGPAA
jgi:S1-C subfamily serine protease